MEQAKAAKDAQLYAEQLQKQAQSDAEKDRQLAEEQSSKYERELSLHSADVDTLRQVKEERNLLKSQVSDAQAQATEAKSALQIAQQTHDEQNQRLSDEITHLRRQLADDQEQLSLLHAHLDQANAKLIIHQQEVAGPIPQVRALDRSRLT